MNGPGEHIAAGGPSAGAGGPPSLAESRRRLIASLDGARHVTLVTASWSGDNWGNRLIAAGTKQLLAGADIGFREIPRRLVKRREGDVLVFAGSGGWCEPHHRMVKRLRQAERNFRRVVVFPSTFDVSYEPVRRALERTNAVVCARECASRDALSVFRDVGFAHDGAFFFDYRLGQSHGKGILRAYRTDPEASGADVPDGNDDISRTAPSFAAWLETIAAHREVHTDRTHVMIAAVLMGKRVVYRDSSYWKNTAIAEAWLQGYDVEREG